MPNENEPTDPPAGGGGDGSDTDDAWADEFARDFEALREKVARIPDDIGDQLANISRQLGASGGTGTTSPQPRRTPQRTTGAPPRQSEPQQPQAPPVPQPEKRPKATHWYFRERPGRG